MVAGDCDIKMGTVARPLVAHVDVGLNKESGVVPETTRWFLKAPKSVVSINCVAKGTFRLPRAVVAYPCPIRTLAMTIS